MPTSAMTDHELALAYLEALGQPVSASSSDDVAEFLNEILVRLDLPLDETEQGLTVWASEQVAAWLLLNEGGHPDDRY